MMVRRILQGLFSAVCGGCLLFSCTSESVNEDVGINGNQEALTNFVLSSNEQSVDFNIEYNVTDGYQVVFNVYSENPYLITSEGFTKKNDLKPIVSAMTDENGAFNVSRVISNGVKEVYVTSDAVGVPALLHGVIENGSVRPVELDLSTLVEENTDVVSRAGFAAHYLGAWDSWGRPDYIDKSRGCNILDSELKAISVALPEWESIKEEYTKNDYIFVQEEAEIWISLLSAKSLFNNALGYYCYTEGMTKEDVSEVIAIPRTNISWMGNTGLKYGEYVKLKYLNPVTKEFEDKFPAGSCIGWVLHRSGFYCAGSQVHKGAYQFYSNKKWNDESDQKDHTAIFKTPKGNVILVFEDVYNESTVGDKDCNDVILHVVSKPESAIVLDTEIPEAPEEDYVEEEVDAVQSLSLIVNVPENDELMTDLYVASQSTLNVEDGNVVGVNDVLYIASAATMDEIVTETYTEDEKTRKVVVRTTVKFSRAEESNSSSTGRTVVRTTVKNTSWDVDIKTRSVFGQYASVEELILASIESHRDMLAQGEVLKIEVTMEFEGVDYDTFVNSIQVPPYSPFIEHVEE